MINETGEFVDGVNDAEELAELKARHAERLENLDKLKDATTVVLTMPCLECKGAKLMSYTIITLAERPWYLRFIGVKEPRRIEREEIGVNCHRCKGTGMEKLRTDSEVD